MGRCRHVPSYALERELFGRPGSMWFGHCTKCGATVSELVPLVSRRKWLRAVVLAAVGTVLIGALAVASWWASTLGGRP